MTTAITIASSVAVALGVLSALWVATDLMAGHKQHMWIMNVVWPVTALWSGPIGVWAYFRFGRAGSEAAAHEAKEHGADPPSKRQPFGVLVAKGTSHCGSGCTLGDIVAELVFLAAPLSVLGHPLFGAWIYDFIAAFLIGIVFQYFTIKPMRQVAPAEGLKEAIKADALSLLAWQVGMYGWMAIVTFVLFRHELQPTSVVFWFMMQLGMMAGFVTSYPVNWWLLKQGVKEAM